MAETRNGGKPGPLETSEPWRGTAELAWTAGDKPRRVRIGATLVDDHLLNESPLRIPWVRTSISWEDSRGEQTAAVHVAENVRPESARIEVLRGFARMVASGPEPRLERLGQVAIFSASTLWRWLEPSPIDALIDESLSTLAEACARPRSWLREERVVQPVSRVRRPARDAVHHLSRHPEHAGHDGVSIYPERILAAIQEEELDIYENRVLIGLVRRLLDRAALRRQRLALALSEADRLREERDRAAKFFQWRRHGRMKKALQREGQDIDSLITAAAEIVARLDKQVRTLDACLYTALGLALRFAPMPATPLRETNILTWDTRYRILPNLWRELSLEAGPEPLDLVLDDPDRVWMDFCLLALLRALGELGFEGEGAIWTSIRRGPRAAMMLRRKTAGGDWCAKVHGEEGAFRLDLHRESATAAPQAGSRIPGQVHANASARTRPKVTTLRFRPTFSAPGPRQVEDVDVWLHPNPVADMDGGDWPDVQLRATVHGSTRRSIAVAPWSFASVDRLGRLVQLHTLGMELAEGKVRDLCPSCNTPARPGRDANDRNCNDPDCGAAWGYRVCVCGVRVPKLLPKPLSPMALEELVFDHDKPHQRALLAEQLGGRDQLADWCMADDGIGTWWMVCPSCGTCGRPGCEGCRRG